MKNWLTWTALTALAASAICPPVSDPDLWWHIVVGRWILHHGTVPSTDHWNQFARGEPWQAYSWSNEVIFAAVDAAAGGSGLFAAKFALSLAVALALAWVLARLSGDRWFGVIFASIATLAVGDYFGLRPQVVSWLCFAAAVFLADCIGAAGPRGRLLLALTATMAVWANSHLSSVIGIAAVAAWLLMPATGRGRVPTAVPAVAAAVFGTLLTPYFGAEWFTAYSKAGHPFSHIYIKEFQPANLYQASAGISLLLFVVAMLFVHYTHKLKAVTVPQLLLAAGLMFAGFTVQKFLPYAAITAAVILAKCWSAAWNSRGDEPLGKLGTGIERLLQGCRRMSLAPSALLWCTAAVGVWINLKPALLAPVDHRLVPSAAVDYALANNLEPPLMTGFNEGGYLLYRLSDERGIVSQPVAIDGRTNVNKPEVVRAFLAALYGKPGWRQYLELVNPNTIIWQRDMPLSSLLAADGSWQEVFPGSGQSNTRWSVFVRKEQ